MTDRYGHEVYAFEPFEGNLPLLRENVAAYGDKCAMRTKGAAFGIEAQYICFKCMMTRFGCVLRRVTVYHGAVTAKSGTVLIGGGTVADSDVQGAGEYKKGISKGTSSNFQVLRNGGIEVQSYTIDSVVKEEQEVLFMKIDVQGAELDVMRGARRLLSDVR